MYILDMSTILFIVSAASAVIAAVSLLFAIRLNSKLKSLQISTDKQIQMTSSSVVGIGNRLLDIEHRLANLRKDQQTLSDTQQDFSYNKAKKLIQQGIALDAVVASTGLSLAEVELIKLIHSQNNSLFGVQA